MNNRIILLDEGPVHPFTCPNQQKSDADFHAKWCLHPIHFRHPAPRDTRARAHHFGAKITWESGRDGVDLPVGFLLAEPRGDNPALSRYFADVLERSVKARAT